MPSSNTTKDRLLAFILYGVMVLIMVWVVGFWGILIYKGLDTARCVCFWRGNVYDSLMITAKVCSLGLLLGLPLGVVFGMGQQTTFQTIVNRWVIRLPVFVIGTVVLIFFLPLGGFWTAVITFSILTALLFAQTIRDVWYNHNTNRRLAALALGFKPWDLVWHIILPSSWRILIISVLRIFCRLAGESAPILFIYTILTAQGQSPKIVGINMLIYKLSVPYVPYHDKEYLTAIALVSVLLIAVFSGLATVLDYWQARANRLIYRKLD